MNEVIHESNALNDLWLKEYITILLFLVKFIFCNLGIAEEFRKMVVHFQRLRYLKALFRY